jgi:plastocyanin
VTARVLVAVLAVAGCSGARPADPGSLAASGPVVEIEAAEGFVFTPAHLTVAAGTTVRWTNKGAVPHTVTSGASSRSSDNPGALLDRNLPAGGTVEMTFTTAGDWPYFCRYHEGMGMAGTVTVTAAPGTAQDFLLRRPIGLALSP